MPGLEGNATMRIELEGQQRKTAVAGCGGGGI